MADIVTISVPTETIKLGDDEMNFVGFIVWSLATHPTFNTDAAGIRSAVRIERKLEGVRDNGERSFILDQEDFNRLRQAVEAPHGGYPVRPGSRMLPFVDAVCDARTESKAHKE